MKGKKLLRRSTITMIVLVFILSMTVSTFGAVISVGSENRTVKIDPLGHSQNIVIGVTTDDSPGWTAQLDKTGQGVIISRPGNNKILVTVTPKAKVGTYKIKVLGMWDGKGKTVTLTVKHYG